MHTWIRVVEVSWLKTSHAHGACILSGIIPDNSNDRAHVFDTLGYTFTQDHVWL